MGGRHSKDGACANAGAVTGAASSPAAAASRGTLAPPSPSPRKGLRLGFSQQQQRVAHHRWRRRRLPVQFFAVVRHAERADHWSALADGRSWLQTHDYARWPLDPPLSDDGALAAREIGRRLGDAAEADGAAVHVVVSSPYFRCVQTAAEMCRELGPHVRLLLDFSLGEVYGPSVMGSEEPAGAVRSIEQVLAYCSARGVACLARSIGTWPTWPEDLQSARQRFAGRFLDYMCRSFKSQRNFVLVTHADGVGAALRVMPSHVNQIVQRIEYGGYFLACRPGAASSSSSGLPEHNECEADQGASPCAWPCGPSSEDEDDVIGRNPRACARAVGSRSWRVETVDIWLEERSVHSGGGLSLRRHVRALMKESQLTRERVEELLGDLSDSPLGGREDQPLSPCSPDSRSGGGCAFGGQQAPCLQRGNTHTSLSTFLFGSSDVGCLEDLRGPSPSGHYQSGSGELPGTSENGAWRSPSKRRMAADRRAAAAAAGMTLPMPNTPEHGSDCWSALREMASPLDSEDASLGGPNCSPAVAGGFCSTAQPLTPSEEEPPEVGLDALDSSAILRRRAASGLSAGPVPATPDPARAAADSDDSDLDLAGLDNSAIMRRRLSSRSRAASADDGGGASASTTLRDAASPEHCCRGLASPVGSDGGDSEVELNGLGDSALMRRRLQSHSDDDPVTAASASASTPLLSPSDRAMSSDVDFDGLVRQLDFGTAAPSAADEGDDADVDADAEGLLA
eukprot:TRINITY_DN23594_c0_g1_i1.p1 TRINITY_DN23594_c0_g1~~TRINITY_DN23594_c0_g1_i1.p1  ORF type:complete len:739 (-),score=153.29 TRINITY_DN23594_c0_g1_i1:182-2398(-)